MNIDDIIKNMMFDINYHSRYFITSIQGIGSKLYYNLYDKETKDNWGYYNDIANTRTLDELKEILIKKLKL